MDFEIATICDAANVDNGKLSLLGSFDKIYSSKLPSIHPSCSLALKIKYKNKEKLPKQFKIDLLSPEEKPLIPSIEFELTTDKTKKIDGDWSTLALAFHLFNLVFEKLGEYHFLIKADGKVIHKFSFVVIEKEK